MTCRISAVAVCWATAPSRSAVRSRNFSSSSAIYAKDRDQSDFEQPGQLSAPSRYHPCGSLGPSEPPSGSRLLR